MQRWNSFQISGAPGGIRTLDHQFRSCMQWHILASEAKHWQTLTNNILASIFYARTKRRDHFGDHLECLDAN